MSDSIEFIEVCLTTSRSDIAILESVLIAENIPYFIENEHVARA